MNSEARNFPGGPGWHFLTASASVLVLRVDQNGVILEANAQALALTGRPLVGQPWHSMLLNFVEPVPFSDWLATESRPRLLNIHSEAGLPQTLQITVERFDADYLLFGEVNAAEQDSMRQEVLELNHELSNLGREMTLKNRELKQLNEQVRQLAYYDPLTNLANRRLFNDRLSQSLLAGKRSGRHGALMFLDLDNFKSLNDIHGHEAGDLLLIEVAKRITSCLREADTVARFGGDEFAVLLDDLFEQREPSMVQAGVIAEKIRASLAQIYLLKLSQGGTEVSHRGSASIGVTVVLGQQASKDEVLKWADTAMYQAKEAGRDQVRFNPPREPESGSPSHVLGPDGNARPMPRGTGWRFLENSASIAVLRVSALGIILAANKQARALIGEPLVGHPWHHILLDFKESMTLADWLADETQPRLIHVRTTTGLPQTLQVTVEPAGPDHILFCEVNAAEQTCDGQDLMALNQKLNNLSRELELKNAELAQFHALNN